MPPRLLAIAVGLVVLPPGLAACGRGGGSDDTSGAVEVVSTNNACTPARSSFPPGKVKLAVKNNSSSATELYVYEDGKVLTEVENVGPGTSRSLTATLKAGKLYQLSCKPGGKEIRVPLIVTT